MTTLLEPIRESLTSSCLKFVDVLGVPTRYYEAGSGEPLVLFHGGQYASLYSLDAWSLADAAIDSAEINPELG